MMNNPNNYTVGAENIPSLRRRKSIRLRGYDYSQTGMYFVTICTQNRVHLFGEIVDDEMILNDAGNMVSKIWNGIPNDFNHIQLHEFIIMPNHIHGIIEITVGADSISAPMDSGAEMDSAPTLGTIMQSFKRYTTIQYIQMVKQNILPPFDKRVWQRNYWEHIVRNKNEYQRIAQYILDNPQKWGMDKLNGGIGNQVMELSVSYNHEAWMI